MSSSPQSRRHDDPDVGDGELLSSGEVAELFSVTVKTVSRWAVAGRLGFICTPGGRYRYRADEAYALLEDNVSDRTDFSEN